MFIKKDLLRTDSSVKSWQNLAINNPKPDLYNVNTHTKFDDYPLIFTKVMVRKWK